MNPKRLITFICIFVLSSTISSSINREDYINLQYKGNHGTHFVNPSIIPADQPSVYYDDEAMEIIIVGPGYATFYDVDIVSISTGMMVYFDTIGGTGDTIDISSLPADDYILTITSSNNNVFEGQFCIEE